MSRLSLAQQIAQLDEPAPLDVDPEALHSGEPTEAGEGAGIGIDIDTAAREHYLDVGPSILRKAQDSIADPKYDGVRVSRKKLLEMEESQSGSADEGESGLENDDLEVPGHSHDEDDSEDEDEEEEEDEDKDEEEEESEEEPHRKTKPNTNGASNSNDPPEPELQQNVNADDLSSTLAQKREEDKRKGRAVVKQLALWDSLLDARIRLQKFAVAANKLPTPSAIPPYVAQHPRCREAQERLARETKRLGEEICGFRKDLIKRENIDVDLDLDARPAKRRRVIGNGDGGEDETGMEVEAEAEAEELLKEASEDVVRMEHAYHKHLTQTLHKWSAKVAAVAPETLRSSNKNSFSAGKGGKASGGVKGVGEQVDEILRADGEKVRKRTRVRRSKGSRVHLHLHLGEGEVEGEEVEKGMGVDGDEDEEVFDDTDFYQQLLRDVIEAKGAGGGAGGGMSEDWMMMQKQRKARKNVDTKASKGRKLRYEVHEKIQNFMVPVPLHNAWHESQIDELFASLLGKGFEHANNGGHAVDDDVDGMGVERVELGAEALKGFRVFG
ncbi:TRAUB-domain-containing protein [Stereum hirsutum FP-91666 SS1]|uniref:Protein BFR2 n=1 Tax=Stereum hirsutum (strain FP-91666) TaxID=721885 RepID=R7S1K3_STEHR|nr:TRAUB-domain-containing protein [Stereum hirsutum FP-91666 SS1]EIM80462.1 TRAUB-domain-containing protein [Stereum hirsutum FP-91666 SS1]